MRSTKDHIHSATSRSTERPCPNKVEGEDQHLKSRSLPAPPHPPDLHPSTQDVKTDILIIFALDMAEERIYC